MSLKIREDIYVGNTGLKLKHMSNFANSGVVRGWHDKLISNDTRSIEIGNLEIGGIYLIAIQYRSQGGSSYYRNSMLLLLSLPCDYTYNGSQVLVFPKVNVLSDYGTDYNGATSTRYKSFACQGGGQSIDPASFNNNPSIFINVQRQTDNLADNYCKVTRLV